MAAREVFDPAPVVGAILGFRFPSISTDF
jgi:hypothetical protein